MRKINLLIVSFLFAGNLFAASVPQKFENQFSTVLLAHQKGDLKKASSELKQISVDLAKLQNAEKVKGRVYKMLRNASDENLRLSKDVLFPSSKIRKRIRDSSLKTNVALGQWMCRRNLSLDCSPRQCLTKAGVYHSIYDEKEQNQCTQHLSDLDRALP